VQASTEAAPPVAREVVLRLAHIHKRFGALVANEDISLHLVRGEVLALLGENGAGKSTLVSILFGHYQADAGSIEVFGQPLPPGQPRAALAAGIGMVHQHFTLADNLSVLENIVLGSEPWWQPWTARRAQREHLLATAQRFGLQVHPEAQVASLSVGERQRVEILKALVRGARILILDEPTAVLTPQESEALFATLKQMVAQGLSIVFISHKLNEVMRVSERVAVLRAGRLVAAAATAQTNAAQLAQWMVGRDVQLPQRRPALGSAAPSAPALATGAAQGRAVCALEAVSTAAARHHAGESRASAALHAVSLALHAGEIVAIAGVSGNGQQALADVLCGLAAPSAGRLRWQAGAMPGTVAQRVQAGIARVPEDRHGAGVVGDLPLWENAVSEHLRGPALSQRFAGLRWVRRTAARAHAQSLVKAFDVRGAGLDGSTRALSGGNMQKLILGRALRPPGGHAPRLIVAHQPSWGLDVGAVAYVQQQLLDARDAGAAVLLISDDLDEVLALGDRIAVLHSGRLTPARPAAAWSREAIGLAMAGADAAERPVASAAQAAT
jgi:general nucleoside transport system ATP-binding protein